MESNLLLVLLCLCGGLFAWAVYSGLKLLIEILIELLDERLR